MSNKQKFREQVDEARFKPKQREAAIAMVEYEFAPKGERMTKQEIADSLGITRKTLHNWDTQDSNFIAYKNYLASEVADSSLAFVYKKLIDSIERGSVRGIEVFLKRVGDLDSHSEVTINGGSSELTADERKAALLKRLQQDGEQDE